MKRKGFFYIYATLCLVFLHGPAVSSSAQEQWVPVAVHIATTVSDGNLSVEDIVTVARAKGIKAVIITDRDSMKWQYGVVTRETNSLFRYGISDYLTLIELEAKKNPDILVIPGLESAPFYYWKGVPFSGDFKLYDWHKHILVMGLRNKKDYEDLPIVSNPRALRRKLRVSDAGRFWPLLVLGAGLILLRKRACGYKDDLGRELCPSSGKWVFLGLTLIISSLILIAVTHPFSPTKYDQYSASARMIPYQTLIDYVNKIGGMTFWAHPEAEHISERKGVRIETRAHAGDLIKTEGYTGFSVFHEGYKEIGRAGGVWDTLLIDYCEGDRTSPVWAIAGLAFDSGTRTDLARAMEDLRMYVAVRNFSNEGLLDGIRRGRVYVSKGKSHNNLLLKEFYLRDKEEDIMASMGEEIKINAALVIYIRGETDISPVPVEIRLIRGGRVIETFKANSPFKIAYEDHSMPQGKTYYRLEITDGNQLIVTNPIFAIREIYRD